jgi:hypothetical protein
MKFSESLATTVFGVAVNDKLDWISKLIGIIYYFLLLIFTVRLKEQGGKYE